MGMIKFEDIPAGSEFKYGSGGTRIYKKINNGQATWVRKNGKISEIGISPKATIRIHG